MKMHNSDPMADEELIARLEKEIAELRRQIAHLKAELLRWENEEASVCPEDVGFVEYIRALKKRCAPPTLLEVTQDQLRAARKLQNRLREALAPFANQTAELDNNSESLSAITDEQWREALEAYFATEDA